MLTPAEKIVGRAFRDRMQAQLAATFVADPPDHVVPNVLAVYRHDCAGRVGRSTALVLKEIYVRSPADHDVPAGLFAYLWRQGACRNCGHTARSATGRLVLAADRPPLRLSSSNS